MIRFAMALGLAVFLPLAATAQTVEIRSGEHEDFSRLTMSLPTRVDYKVEPTETGARVVFPGSKLRLDTSAVFDRIQRDRLADLSWQGASQTLELRFDCDCAATLFWHERSMLVLDVVERPEAERQKSAASEPAITTSNTESPATPPAHLTGFTKSRSVDLMMRNLPDAQLPDPEEPPLPGLDPATRDRLLKQMGRAASQGLLSPRMDRPKQRVNSTDVPEQPGTKAPPAEPTGPEQGTASHINLKAQSSIDRDFLGSVLAQHESLADSGCYSAQEIDVASWGDDTSFAAQIAPLRRRLTGEFDEPDPKAVTDLVRRYLYFGFGAEAHVLVQLLPADAPGKALLSDLARIADQGFAAPGSRLSGLMDCQSPAALWSALSYEELPRDKPIDTDAILRAFNALPDHLRAHYGPILAQRFLRAGDKEMSIKLLRILDRNPETLSPQSDLAVADLHSAQGDEDAADAVLDDVIKSNSEPSISALLRQIDQQFAAGHEISFELAQLAGAYAYEHQSLEDGPQLAAAYIRALIASGSVDEAFDEFDRLKPRLGEARALDLRSDLLTRLAAQPDDIAFLHYALHSLTDLSEVLEADAANRTARRLLLLGFAEEAGQLLTADAPPGHRAARERLLLRAEQALATGAPRLAIVELLGLTGEDANLLRARARSMVGEHKAAQVLYAAADQPDSARREAWRGADWAQAADENAPVYDRLADLFSEEADTPESEASTAEVLARNRSLAETSAEMRATFDALLMAHPAPEVSAN